MTTVDGYEQRNPELDEEVEEAGYAGPDWTGNGPDNHLEGGPEALGPDSVLFPTDPDATGEIDLAGELDAALADPDPTNEITVPISGYLTGLLQDADGRPSPSLSRSTSGTMVPAAGVRDEGDDYGQTYTMVDGQVVDEREDLRGTPIHERPLLPHWSTVTGSVIDTGRRWVRVVAFHSLRAPKYWARLTVRAPYGIKRLFASLRLWASDPDFAEAKEMMRITGKGDVSDLHERHRETVKARRSALAVMALVVSVATLYGWALLPLWQFIGLLILVADVFGFVGRPLAATPIVERVRFNKATAPPLTEALIVEALRACGAEPKGRRPIQIIQPPIKIRTGWEALVKLGVSAEGIIKKKETFAAELDRPTNCVWLTRDPEDAAGDLRIVITRRSLRSARMPEWPFRHGGTLDHFTDLVPVGVDETGEPVGARKAHQSTVYGGIMGAGKTVSMINSVLGQAVDPRVELHLNDLKGGTDWRDFAPIAHFLRAGTDKEDEEAILADLDGLNRRMDARFKQLHEVMEEGAHGSISKTTSTLADRRDLDLHPIVVVVDETQEMFEFSDHAKLYQERISRLIKKGRAVAITVEAGTQEVKQATVPFAPLCSLRHCMSVTGHQAVDLVLGTGAYSAGFRADDLTAEDRGIGYFGSGKEISLVRSYYLDPEEGEVAEVVERLRSEREACNRLTGMAAGEIEPDDDYRTIVDDLADYWPGSAAKMSHELLARHLAAALPDTHSGLTADKLSSRGRSHGLTSVANCKGLDGKFTLKGFAHADVLAHRSEEAE